MYIQAIDAAPCTPHVLVQLTTTHPRTGDRRYPVYPGFEDFDPLAGPNSRQEFMNMEGFDTKSPYLRSLWTWKSLLISTINLN